MNTPYGLRALVLIAICLCTSAAFSIDAPSDSQAEKIAPARFEAKVLKVHSAKDGAAIFRAYVVSWKGQEVIASDPLAKSDYRVGDTVTVLSMNQPFPQGKEPYRLLAFTIVAPPAGI